MPATDPCALDQLLPLLLYRPQYLAALTHTFHLSQIAPQGSPLDQQGSTASRSEVAGALRPQPTSTSIEPAPLAQSDAAAAAAREPPALPEGQRPSQAGLGDLGTSSEGVELGALTSLPLSSRLSPGPEARLPPGRELGGALGAMGSASLRTRSRARGLAPAALWAPLRVVGAALTAALHALLSIVWHVVLAYRWAGESQAPAPGLLRVSSHSAPVCLQRTCVATCLPHSAMLCSLCDASHRVTPHRHTP